MLLIEIIRRHKNVSLAKYRILESDHVNNSRPVHINARQSEICVFVEFLKIYMGIILGVAGIGFKEWFLDVLYLSRELLALSVGCVYILDSEKSDCCNLAISVHLLVYKFQFDFFSSRETASGPTSETLCFQ